MQIDVVFPIAIPNLLAPVLSLAAMSLLVEQAGGMSTNGTTRIVDIKPVKIHERSPIYLGCNRDVNMIMDFLKK